MNRPRRMVVVLSAMALVLGGIAACGKDPMSPRAAGIAPSLPSFQHGAGSGGPSGGSGSGGGSGTDPNFLHPAVGTPSILNPVIVFTAVKGEDKIVKMFYQPRRLGDSSVFALFRVPQQALDFRPDGTPIASGDSVQITMTLVDADRGIIDFQPSGLRFSAKHPASLKISYRDADQDLNQDGRVDILDLLLRLQIHIICRESPSDPWAPIPSINDAGLGEVQAAILGFSGYAIEY
jgi:hypothetical protein